MPSGSKKRKAMKKPRPGELSSSPLGEPSELEPGSLAEESLIEEGEKMDEGLEASAEVCAVDGIDLIGEASQREDSEGAGIEGALTPGNRRPLANDPPERPEMQDPSFTASKRVSGDAMFEKERGTPADLPQEDSSPLLEDRSETPFGEMASGNPLGAELRPGLERDEDLSDAPPIAIELGSDETRAESFEAPVGTERKWDEPVAKEEPMADVASDDTEPSFDSTNYGETIPDEALSGEIKGGLEENTEIPGAPPVNLRSELEENESELRENQIGNELELEDSSEKKEMMAQEDLGHDVDTPSVGEIEANSEALVAETKQEVEQDVEPADAPPIDLESGSAERGMVPPPKAQVGNGPESDESSAREEAAVGTDVELPDAPPINIEPADEGKSVPFESQNGNESELAESSVKDKLIAGSDQEGMGPDNVTRRTDCVDTVADQGLDENLAAAGRVSNAAPEDEQPENVENTDARDTETSAASGNIEAEEGADVTAVKTDEDSARVELGMNDTIPETQPEDVPEVGPIGNDAPLESDIRASEVDAQADIDNEHDGVEMDSDARLASIESEATDGADAETTNMSEEGLLSTQPEMCQDKDQTKSETNVLESDAGEIEPGEMEQSAVPRIESEIDESGREIGASMDVASRDAELEQVPIVRKGESESEAGLDDFKCEANPRGGEEAETETKPEFNATLVDTQEDEGVEVLATEVESQDRASVEAIPDMVLENAGNSMEAEAASEQERVADTPLHFDVSIKPRSEEMEGGEKVNPENDSSIEQADVSCSQDDFNKGAENSGKGIKPEDTNTQEYELEDDTEPVNKALSEPFEVGVQTDDSIADVDSQGTIPDMGPDARSELSVLQPGAEAPLNAEFDQAGFYETESGQQDGIDDRQDQQDLYQQDEHQDRFTDSIGKPPEAPPRDSNGRMTGMEPEAAESEVSKLEAKFEDPSELKLEETSALEFDQGQQHVFAAEKDQHDMQDNYEQPQQQESETDSFAEPRELPPTETNQEQALPFSATAEGGSAFSAAEEVAVIGSGLPAADDQKMLDKNDGAYAADAELPLHDKGRGAFDAEQSDELKENRVEHDAVDNDDTLVQEKGSSADTSQGSLSTGQDQDVESEQPSMPHVIDTKVAADETHAAERKDAQPSFDKQELSNDLTYDVPSGQSEMVEDAVSTISPSKLESSVGKHEPKDRIVCEQERGFNFPFENIERDVGEEEAALSTAAEAGSAITDFDEHPYYQLSEFTGSEQDADIFERGESGEALALEGKESSDSPRPRPPDLIATGPTEHEAEPADARSEGRKEDLLGEEVEWKTAQDFEPTRAHEEVAPEREGLELNATRMLESVNTPVDVHVSEESNAPDEDATTMEAGDRNECRQGAASTVLRDIPEGNFDTVEPRLPSSKSIDSTGVLVEESPSNTSDGAPLQVASGQDVNDTEGFNQQETQEASLPVEVPVHNLKQRALDQGSGKGDAHPSREGTLQSRGNSFGCCGMFDLLLGRS